MNTIQSQTLPWSTGQYQPYFYHAGLYRHEPFRPTGDGPRPSSQTYSGYDFSSERPLFGRLEPPQTVEEVVQAGYFAVPRSDPVTAIISDRQHTSRFALADILCQFRQRREIYQRNIEELNEAMCEAHNSVFRQMADGGLTVANQRQQYSVTKQIQKLYEQQREERINLWRDLSRLRLVLPETVQQYLAAYRKVSALGSQGDEP